MGAKKNVKQTKCVNLSRICSEYSIRISHWSFQRVLEVMGEKGLKLHMMPCHQRNGSTPTSSKYPETIYQENLSDQHSRFDIKEEQNRLLVLPGFLEVRHLRNKKILSERELLKSN